MSIKRIYLSIVVLLAGLSGLLAQPPCLQGYTYRSVVTINNPAVTAQSGVIELKFRATDLIEAGQMLSTCADIRFMTAGNVLLRHWIDENSDKTNSQSIWVELDNIAAGTTSIYMFYGNPAAISQSDTGIFDFFDDFIGNTLSGEWNLCSGNVTLNNGFVTLLEDASINTGRNFPKSFMSQAHVTSVTGGGSAVRASFGQLPWNNSNSQFDPGYSMSFNTPANNFEVFRTGAGCPMPSLSRGNTTGTSARGIWSFTWKTAGQLLLSPPGVAQITYAVDSLGAYNNYGVSLSVDGPGTMEVDWVALWHVNNLPFSGTVGAGEQISTPVSIDIAGNTSICTGSNIVLSATNISGAFYSWYYNGEITTTVGLNQYSYTRSGSIVDFSGNYSVVVSLGSPVCGTHADEVNVIVYPTLSTGSITPGIDVCALTNSGTVQLTGYGGTVDYWEYRVLPGSVWNPQTVKSDIYAYSGLTESYAFRAHVDAGACGSAYSGESQVIVSPTSAGGILSENATVCQNSSASLFLSGYTGEITRWESMRVGQTWQNISQTNNSLSYTNIQDSTYYRVLVTSGECPPAYSNTILRAVSPPTVEGVVTGGKYVCAGSSKMDTLYLQGYTGNVLRWENSPSATGPWSTNTTTSDYFIYSGSINTTFYRALVESPGCNALYSVIDTVIVEQQPSAGTLNGSTTVCATSNSGLLQLSGYSGKVTNWYSSVDSASWLPLAHNYDTLHYYNLQQKRYYRATVNSQHNVCLTDSSNFATINVSPSTVEGALYSSKTQFCVDSNQGVIRINNKTGNVVRWESSPTGNAPWTTVAYGIDSLGFTNLPATAYYHAIVKSGVCAQDTTSNLQLRIDQLSQGGTLLGSNTEVCELVNSGTLNLMSYTGSIVRWEASTDGLSWGTVPDAPAASYTFSGLTDTTLYRVIVQNGSICKADTSTVHKITVNPLPDVSFTANSVNLGDAVNFNNITTIAGGTVQSWFWDFGNEESSASKNPKYNYPSSGTYRVKLTATSNKLCVDSVANFVSVFDLPDVSFNFENVCHRSEMPFTITSSFESGTNYIWNFGDATPEVPAVNATINHWYNVAGNYNVTLKAISSSGGIDSITRNVIVYPRSIPDFSVDNICEGNTARFSNKTTPTYLTVTYLWDFGNGLTDTRTDPEVTYDTHEEYPVILVATTNFGCSDTAKGSIRVYPQPVAAFTVEDVPYRQPSVFFNESEIEYGNLNYNWEFGDGKTSDTLNPIYIYESAGVYLARLTATSESGCSHSFEKAINIFALPVSDFSVADVCFGDSSKFINASTIPSGSLNFEWTFGDNQTSTKQLPVHYYSQPGTYQVRLICISDKGGRDTVYREAKVYDLPDVDFTFNEACDGYSTYFENTSEVSDGSILSVLWDFGEGTNSVQVNPVKEYLNPAIYIVKLEVLSSTGCKSYVTKDVIVHHNPVTDFGAESVCVGRFTEFSNYTTIDNTNRPYTLVYLWNFDDGSSSTVVEPEYRYSGPGLYRVVLSVTSDAGCIDTIVRYIEVYALPDAYAGQDTTVIKGFPITLQGSGGEFYEWFPETGLSNISIPDPEARPMESTTYSLRVTDGNSCVSYDTLVITVDDAMRIIPSNVLTPNDNNENDTWNIVNIDSYPDAKITLFDRWGKMVYETINYQNDWTGTNKNGDILPDGTYYYVIVLTPEVVYKGAITILRDK